MVKYKINIFDDNGWAGTLDMPYPYWENLVKIELELENAVELFTVADNKPVANYAGRIIKTDSDGFCSLIKR